MANQPTNHFDPVVNHHFTDGVYAKEAIFPAGSLIMQHSHKYSHISILATGRVMVVTDDTETEFVGPACIEIKKGVEHSIYAIEDSVWYCIHATDVVDKHLVDHVLIQEG